VIGILVGSKGRGSNMEAIIRAFPDQVGAVIGTRADCPAIDRAQQLGIPVRINEAPERELAGISLLCLAGYLRLLAPEALDGRTVINIHPSLLPKFGGPGMYGTRVHAAVLAAGETESGCTVHRVTEVYDEGEIIWQERVPVLKDDTVESLAARVLVAEHRAYPEAIRLASIRLVQEGLLGKP